MREICLRRYVLLVRMHYEVDWQEDLVLFLRSIMHEVTEAGMHMYLLVEVRFWIGNKGSPEVVYISLYPTLQASDTRHWQ